MNLYYELKTKHQTEVNNFPMVFAFSDKQFEEAMSKLGLTVNDTDKVYSIGGGGLIRKTDSKAYNEMFERMDKEMKEAINSPENGEQFIYDMFNYELANHEYCITYSVSDTLRALGLTIEEVNADERLLNGLNKAKANQRENC